MADFGDQARRLADLELNLALQHREPVPDVPVTGQCANCGEAVEHPRRWCDPDCERDHARRGYA